MEIVSHMVDLMAWAERLARGEYRWEATGVSDWDTAVERFFAGLANVDAALADTSAAPFPAGVMFQGPIADALTHTGQIALLRRMHGAPVKPMNYFKAEI